MKNEISLSCRELKRIQSIAEEIYGTDPNDWSSVRINVETGSGIGSIVTATYDLHYKGLVGDFTVTITDVEDW
jgi:hypothetical protein